MSSASDRVFDPKFWHSASSGITIVESSDMM